MDDPDEVSCFLLFCLSELEWDETTHWVWFVFVLLLVLVFASAAAGGGNRSR